MNRLSQAEQVFYIERDRKILKLREMNVSNYALAKRFGLSYVQIGKIICQQRKLRAEEAQRHSSPA